MSHEGYESQFMLNQFKCLFNFMVILQAAVSGAFKLSGVIPIVLGHPPDQEPSCCFDT